MATINQLSSIDTLQAGDQIPVYDASNGDARKASMTTLVNYISDNIGSSPVVFDTVAQMVAATTLEIGDYVVTKGYYSLGDGGANAYEVVAASTGTADGGSYINLTGTSLQAQGIFEDALSIKQFGASGLGVSNASAAIQAAIDAATTMGRSVYVPAGTYLCSGLTLTCNIDSEVGGVLKNSATTHATMMTVEVSNLRIGLLEFHGNEKEFTALRVNGDQNYADNIIVHDARAIVGEESTSNCAIVVTGSYNTFGFINAYDFINNGTANGSMPQVFLVTTGGTHNKLESIHAKYCRAVVLTDSSGILYVDNVHSVDSMDNGVYALDGTIVIGDVYYSSNTQEEAVVIKGGKANIGNITLYGNGTAVGVDHADEVYIGELVSIPHTDGDTTNSFIRIRNNPSSNFNGKVHIGHLAGTIRGQSLFNFGLNYPTAECEFFTIEGGDVIFEYDATLCSPNDFMNIQACHSFNIANLNVRIVDINDVLTTGNVSFYMKAPLITRLDRVSVIDNVNVTIVASDRITQIDPTYAVWRGQYFHQYQIRTYNMIWQMNVGPYLREISYNGGVKNSVNITPDKGAWRQGEDLILRDASTAPFNTRCSYSNATTLSANAASGATVVTVTDNTGITAGDLVALQQYDASTGAKSLLSTTVASIVGSDVTLNTALSQDADATSVIVFSRWTDY